MSAKLNKEQRLLCLLLSRALTGSEPQGLWELSREADTEKLIYMAGQHKVLPLLYGVLCEIGRAHV